MTYLDNLWFHLRVRLRFQGMMRAIYVLLGCALMQGCVTPGTLGKAIEFERLPGWGGDTHSQVWPALLKSCAAVKRIKVENFAAACEAAKALSNPDDKTVKAFLERWFEPRPLRSPDGDTGLITGYYAPILKGSRQRSERFRWPLYGPPSDLVRVELSELFPELKNKRVRGRLVGNRVVPFYDRDELDKDDSLLAGQEVLWVDSAADAFFLHIQGSGRVRLDDGSLVGVGYADQNGHPYRSIGRELIKREEIRREDVSLQSIRAWLVENPDEEMALYATNPSYVFFSLNEDGAAEPKGSLAVRLTPERSIAVDRTRIPFGLPMWIETTLPGSQTPWRRTVMAQDTGGAIRGEVRADVYFGSGDRAEQLAGNMKQRGRLWVLHPRPKSN